MKLKYFIFVDNGLQKEIWKRRSRKFEVKNESKLKNKEMNYKKRKTEENIR